LSVWSIRAGLILEMFKAVAANLPLLLPFTVTILSIFTRASDIKNAESVLRMSNDIAIGIVSFDIWALSASRSDPSGRIIVNRTTMISGDFVLPFLLCGLLVAVGCVVLTRYPFQNDTAKFRTLLTAFVVTITVYSFPFGVLEPIVPEHLPAPVVGVPRYYTVAIPFQDPSVAKLFPAALSSRRFVWIEKGIKATSASDAQGGAVNSFMAGSESDQAREKQAKVTFPSLPILDETRACQSLLSRAERSGTGEREERGTGIGGAVGEAGA
jgi:hypothetical protein